MTRWLFALATALALVGFPARSAVSQQVDAAVAAGDYASRQIVSSRARLRPANRWVRVATTSVLLHSVTRDDAGELVAESRFCSVEQEPLGRTRTMLGPQFVSSVAPWKAKLVVRDGAVELAEHVLVMGATLQDRLNEPLPTDRDDPRVVDMDGDGQPGFTVQVDGMIDGEVYMVQRLIRRLRGTLDADGRVTGRISEAGGQEVVGASNQILKTFTPRFQPDPDESRSTFIWVPVPAGSTCDSVLAASEELFGDEED